MDVTFRPPAIGSRVVPIRLTGAGTLDLTDEGIHVTAAEAGGRGRGLLIVLGLIAAGVVVAIMRNSGFGEGLSYGAGAGLGLVLIQVLRMAAPEGERAEKLFPWGNIKKVTYDATTECMIVVVKGMKPKGGLYVLQPKDSPLQKQIEKHLASHS